MNRQPSGVNTQEAPLQGLIGQRFMGEYFVRLANSLLLLNRRAEA